MSEPNWPHLEAVHRTMSAVNQALAIVRATRHGDFCNIETGEDSLDQATRHDLMDTAIELLEAAADDLHELLLTPLALRHRWELINILDYHEAHDLIDDGRA